MIQVTPHMRVLVAVEPADFRRGIDGLARLCKEELGSDPFSGTVFVFTNRRRTGIRILVYDGQGFWLCYKRLSTGKFVWWPSAGGPGAGGLGAGGARRTTALEAHELQVLLSGGDPWTTGSAAMWRRVDGRASTA